MIEQHLMKNGIHVIMEEMSGYRSISIGVWIRTGSMYEKRSNNGMAHVIEHMLFKGTKNRSAVDIANEMTALGGNMDAFTCKDCTCYYAKTLDIYAENTIELLGDMLCHSLFDEKELKKELGVILEEIDMYEDSPEDMVHEHLQMEVWKNHPLGYLISGEKERVSTFDRTQLLEFFKKYYVGNNMVISIAGHFEKEKILRWIEMYFSEIIPGKRSQLPLPIEFHKIFWKKEKDIEQNHVCLAFDCCSVLSDERYVLTVANNILGGNMNSRLFMKIRDELGMTYAIYSYGSSYEPAGLFQIYAAMQPAQTDTVLEAIFSEIKRVAEFGVTQNELDIAIQQIQTELVLGYESSYNRMSSLGKSLLLRDRIIPLDEELERIRCVSTEDIQQFFAKYLRRESCSMAIVGNVDGDWRKYE